MKQFVFTAMRCTGAFIAGALLALAQGPLRTAPAKVETFLAGDLASTATGILIFSSGMTWWLSEGGSSMQKIAKGTAAASTMMGVYQVKSWLWP